MHSRARYSTGQPTQSMTWVKADTAPFVMSGITYWKMCLTKGSIYLKPVIGEQYDVNDFFSRVLSHRDFCNWKKGPVRKNHEFLAGVNKRWHPSTDHGKNASSFIAFWFCTRFIYDSIMIAIVATHGEFMILACSTVIRIAHKTKCDTAYKKHTGGLGAPSTPVP